MDGAPNAAREDKNMGEYGGSHRNKWTSGWLAYMHKKEKWQ